ncbi:hypothetical protein F8154_02785 [Alkaliphilus pronyensis]|uniref:Lipoprotein n=1 Tax=Alkaliphilus pronyensis TaxID=1482732 RepID=A0A6I0FFT7_9FIRM|nr:hypothetical protein [Alkaliphilus pronyensis]KAB3537238.1 hypothetical protein F8154_02785 [Alkaliphilus pronyensis]
MDRKDVDNHKLFILFMLCTLVLLGCSNPKAFSNQYDIWQEEIGDGEISIYFEMLNGEETKVLDVEPGKEYLIEYELRFDRGVFDIFITNEVDEILFFKIGNEEIKKNLLVEEEKHINLHIIGGTVKLKATEESFKLKLQGNIASGSLTVKWNEM